MDDDDNLLLLFDNRDNGLAGLFIGIYLFIRDDDVIGMFWRVVFGV